MMEKEQLSSCILSFPQRRSATCHSREGGSPALLFNYSQARRKPFTTITSLPRRRESSLLSHAYTILIFFALFITSCTSTPDLWYKTGATQNNFNLDSRECEIIAEQFALQQSETGKRIDPVNFAQQYLQCLNAKGWSQTKPETAQNHDQPPLPKVDLSIEQKESSLSGFDHHINLPDDFSLLSRHETRIGPTVMEQFFWQGEGNTFINLIFQQNNETTFELTPYPVANPYHIYTSGTGDKARDLLQWSTFFGKIQDEWVMGIGAFYLANKNQRLIIVITKNLDTPSTQPPPNLILSSNQHAQIEAFSNHWITWLESQFPEKSKWTDWWKKLIPNSL